jgi:hypothetical protein
MILLHTKRVETSIAKNISQKKHKKKDGSKNIS